jgi:N-acetylmuramoyl-L-alanine amidase
VFCRNGLTSNYTEGNILDSEEGQNEIAKAISDAIISYKNEYYGNGGNASSSKKSHRKVKRYCCSS